MCIRDRFKDARMRRYKSIQKMVDLLDTASKLAPKIPSQAFFLDPNDPEWDDDMVYPTIQYNKFIWQGLAFGANLFIYAYNYNTFTFNRRLRTLRYFFPVVHVLLFQYVYWDYKTQLLKVNLFDEYVQLRARELVEQNEYLLEHEDFKRFIWWFEDFKETLAKVHRQANNHEASDFKDSELVLQDFIKRYTNPALNYPLLHKERSSFL
eukprot:TRINITY_DN543_c0_g1_i2.p1 TRINITY_DN543_c0_g1~~TRINITY_DN543_c0_g1_i2.p1  ORF type:complete len:208 (+),score=35.99 TRINITY_DN543_c0_g1_i2:66-689(+)